MAERTCRNSRRGGVLITVLALLLALAPGALSSAAQAYTPPSNDIQFELEGCDFYNGLTLPIDFGGTARYACPQGEYTHGNLGKGWNELDLVPFRMTTHNKVDQASTFNVIIAVDYIIDGTKGYDFISVPTIFRQSTQGCSVSSGDLLETDKVTGGEDKALYRVLTVTVPANGDCQIEWYNQLAIGSSEVPGSSLQAYMFEGEDFGNPGKRTVPIPVGLAQSLSKDMTASRGSDHTWTVSKQATPAVITQNTCSATTDPIELPVSVQVSWTRSPAQPGAVTINTTVYARNPAARALTMKVMDRIYAGTGQTQLLDTATANNVVVPPNTSSFAVLTHSYTWANAPVDAEFVNDVATAQFVETVPGVPLPGPLTAAKQAPIVNASAANRTATITDEEWLTGPAGVQFSAAAPSIGAFDGYTAGTKTVGPVKWGSGVQNGSDSLTFAKTLYIPKGTSGTGQLKDIAKVTGLNGVTNEATAATDLNISTLATLTIRKSIPDVLTGDETATFTFDVKDSEGQVVADDLPITFTAGQTSQTTDVSNLAPGVYTVLENPTEGWDAPGPPVEVDLSGTTCAGTAPFINTHAPATATAIKVTDPAGQSGGWDMTLTGGESPETVATDETGTAAFSPLAEGSYTITETMKNNWEFVEQSGDCEFTVDYPRDAGKQFTCTLTNKRSIAQLGLVKRVVPAGDPTQWSLSAVSASSAYNQKDITGAAGGTGGPRDVYAGMTYNLSEAGSVAGYTNGQTWVCTSGGTPYAGQDGASVTLQPGDVVSCEITNSRDAGAVQITKEFNPLSSGFVGSFTVAYSCVNGSTPVTTGTAELTAGQSTTVDGLPTGTVCTVTEPTLPAAPSGWQFNNATFVPGDGKATVTTAGETVAVRVVNSISAVSPENVKQRCPINPTLPGAKVTKVGNRVLVKKVKTNNACAVVKPVVLCRPVAHAALGETAFCRTVTTRKGYVKVKTRGYDRVRVTVVVRAKPKPGFNDDWKASTWRKSWLLK